MSRKGLGRTSRSASCRSEDRHVPRPPGPQAQEGGRLTGASPRPGLAPSGPSWLDRPGKKGQIPDDEICDPPCGGEHPNAKAEPTRLTEVLRASRRGIAIVAFFRAGSSLRGEKPRCAIH